MAKNNYRMNVNQYANQEDNIRKAKGNPNKNIHHKKKTATTAAIPPAATWRRRSWTRPTSRSASSCPHG